MPPALVPGVPLSVAVPFWLSMKLTPAGKVPDMESDGVGEPLAVMVNVFAAPAANVVLLTLVISGACEDAVHERETSCLPCG